MKVSVRVRGEWLAVPCGDGEHDIAWLGREAVGRYHKTLNRSVPRGTHDSNHKAQAAEQVSESSAVVAAVRKTRGGALLAPSDLIKDVLDDEDFVSVVGVGVFLSPSKYVAPSEYLTLDGNSLNPDDLVTLGAGGLKIRLSSEAENRVLESRALVERIVAEQKVVYGITTGFGKFARKVISQENLGKLQLNLIRSHAAGVGAPLSPEKTRMLLALRINVLAKGCSGISLPALRCLINAFNASCLPWVPEKGTVGASGDLAPLSHLALGMLGEGRMWSPSTGWGDAKYVMESHNLKPIVLGAKEGLALINGTQFITAIGTLALSKAENIVRQCDVVAALTLEVMKGTSRAFDSVRWH
ncbi:hypothetical protein HAZT_HAZT008272 [Hyalella azteca]|uniref:Par3/HAL N-terminal domain-containing protein n=1 Tax=Hyalella azteca TaxID=294128 RepID=A0A6A0GQY9_HYAAZ|nr:hypothetical protein HAZT_HAZT008272 [Hyalella azteca]